MELPGGILENPVFKMLAEMLSDGVYFVDANRVLRYWSPGAERISGYSSEEVIGHSCADNVLCHVSEAGCPLCVEGCPLAAAMQDGLDRRSRVFLKHKDGHRVPVRVSVAPIRDDKGVIIGGMETFSDDTSQMSALEEMEELRQQALICPLTGLGNRRYATQMIENLLEAVKRDQRKLAIYLMEIDNFKAFNDNYGDQAGDVVLKMVGRTLTNAMRGADFLARWSGIQFLALEPGIRPIDVQPAADRFRALVEQSSRALSKNRLTVTVSIGATISHTEDTPETLRGRVERCMRASRHQGGNRVTVENS